MRISNIQTSHTNLPNEPQTQTSNCTQTSNTQTSSTNFKHKLWLRTSNTNSHTNLKHKHQYMYLRTCIVQLGPIVLQIVDCAIQRIFALNRKPGRKQLAFFVFHN